MMHFEDEDIVLCESPLHKYLEEVTNEPFEKYSPSRSKNDCVEKEKRTEETQIDGSWGLIDQLDSLLNRLMLCKSADFSTVVCGCSTLLNSSLLAEEEEHLLSELRDEVYKLSPPGCSVSDQSVKSVPHSWVIACFVVLFSVSVHYILGKTPATWLLMVTGVFLVGIFLYFCRFTNNRMNDMLATVGQFSSLFAQYNILIDKVIRHIRETEVIMHGYSHINKFNKTELRTGQKCIRLRCCLIDGLTDLFHQLRSNTRILIGSKRNEVLFDYKEEHIAVMPLETFSEVLYSTSDDGDAPALARLKSAVSLYRFQMSEYVYMVVVLLFALYREEEMEGRMNDILFSIKGLNRRIEKIHKSLDYQLGVSIKLVFERKDVETVVENKALIQPSNHDVLHSAEVHLHAALARVEDMKNVFANTISSDIPVENLNNLSGQFVLCLENARYCIEEIVERKQPKDDSAELTVNKANDVSDDGVDRNVVLHPLTREELGDVLYEGESENVDIKEIHIDADIESKVKKSRESRKLMRELRTILSVKESPVGLMEFPLKKSSLEDEFNETEFSYETEIDAKTSSEPKRSCKSAYVYDPDDNDDDEGDSNEPNFALPPVEQIRMPSFGGSWKMEEVSFGCSDNENEEMPDIE